MSEAPTLSVLTWVGERAPLAKALVAAQKATESIKKAATNPVFKSKYADLASVWDAVREPLRAAGLLGHGSDGYIVTTLGADLLKRLHDLQAFAGKWVVSQTKANALKE